MTVITICVWTNQTSGHDVISDGVMRPTFPSVQPVSCRPTPALCLITLNFFSL